MRLKRALYLYSVKTKLLFLFLTALSLNILAGTSEPGSAKKTRAVCGQLSDAQGEAIVGAAIKIVETGEVVYTDLSGRYTLSLPTDQGSTLKLHAIGYLPLEITGASLHNFDTLTLKEL